MIQLLIRRVRQSAFYALNHIPKSLISNQGNLCLMFHGVTPQNFKHINFRQLPLANFKKHLSILAKNYRLVDLETFFLEKDNPNPKPLLTLTFDDGFLNNLEVAAPWLVHKKWPATVFVTALSQSKFPMVWADFLDIAEANPPVSNFEINGEPFWFNNKRYRSARNNCSLRDIIRYQHADWPFKLALFDALDGEKLLENYQQPRSWFQLMTPSQIKQMDQMPGISIGAHGNYHNNLGSLSLPEMRQEIKDHAMWLQELLGRKVPFFAFSDGCYNDEVKMACRENGFVFLLAGGGWRSASDSADKQLIDRKEISNCGRDSTQLFDLYR